jgi:hypothetical protein
MLLMVLKIASPSVRVNTGISWDSPAGAVLTGTDAVEAYPGIDPWVFIIGLIVGDDSRQIRTPALLKVPGALADLKDPFPSRTKWMRNDLSQQAVEMPSLTVLITAVIRAQVHISL